MTKKQEKLGMTDDIDNVTVSDKSKTLLNDSYKKRFFKENLFLFLVRFFYLILSSLVFQITFFTFLKNETTALSFILYIVILAGLIFFSGYKYFEDKANLADIKNSYDNYFEEMDKKFRDERWGCFIFNTMIINVYVFSIVGFPGSLIISIIQLTLWGVVSYKKGIYGSREAFNDIVTLIKAWRNRS